MPARRNGAGRAGGPGAPRAGGKSRLPGLVLLGLQPGDRPSWADVLVAVRWRSTGGVLGVPGRAERLFTSDCAPHWAPPEFPRVAWVPVALAEPAPLAGLRRGRPRGGAGWPGVRPGRGPGGGQERGRDGGDQDGRGPPGPWSGTAAGEPAPPRPRPSMTATEPSRRAALAPGPPASTLSADSPVRVSVSTVVVRSGAPRWRTVAFWTPRAAARMAMVANRPSPAYGEHARAGQRRDGADDQRFGRERAGQPGAQVPGGQVVGGPAARERAEHEPGDGDDGGRGGQPDGVAEKPRKHDVAGSCWPRTRGQPQIAGPRPRGRVTKVRVSSAVHGLAAAERGGMAMVLVLPG